MLNKKLWTKPQLIILTRGTPEESVLEHCKRIGENATALPEAMIQLGCDKGVSTNCAACQSRSGS